MAISHIYNQTVADGTATSVIRPSDWNSAHNQFMTISGNTAGASTLSGTNIVFSAGNNITLSANGNSLVFSGGPAGGAAIKGSGTYTQNTGTVEFANSNGITFGLSNNGTMTASYTVPSTAGLLSAINFSAGTTSNNSASIKFADSNGISFGLNAGTITATVKTDYQSSNANYLTSQSNQAVSGANGSFTFQTVTFANSNGVSFSTGTQGLYATVKTDYLTTAMASDAGSNFVGLNSAVTGASLTVNSSGISINVPAAAPSPVYVIAGTTNGSLGTIQFSDSNGVSFGLNGATITASAVGGAGGAALKGSGTYTQNTGTVEFANSNGITFGLSNNGTMTASYTVPNVPAQTQQPMYFSLSNSNTSASTMTFGNLNGVSWSFSNGSIVGSVATNYQSQGAYLTTARASNDAIGLNSALTANGVSVTANSSGLSLNFPAFLTTAALSGDTTKYAGVGSAITNGTMTFNTAGLSLNLSNHLTTAMLSNAVTISNINISAGTTSSNQSSIGFSNANGMSFGFSNASITGSYTVPTQSAQTVGMYAQGNTTGQSSSSTVNATSMNFSGAGIASVGMSAGTMIISVPSGGGAGDGYNIVQAGTLGTTGTTWSSLSASVFLNGSNITVSQNNSNQIVISAPATSSLSATGNFSISTNGATISMGANAVGLGSTITGNALMTLNTAGIQFNGVGLAGTSTGSAGANISLSMTLNSSGLNISASVAAPGGGGGYTALSLQNRQLGASTSINSMGGQNSLWLAPIRVAAPVYASTMLGAMVSYSGTITSAATARVGQTIRLGIWAQHTDPASTSRFDTYWTENASLTFWNSGTSSYSYAFSLAGGQTTGSSAGSNLGTASVMGVRQIILPIGSTLSTGLYVFGILNSSSSAGYSAAMSRQALVMDNPASLGMGTFGQATNNSIGYVDGGTYLTTTGALPNTIALNQIGGVANVMPYFKIGAV